MRLARMREYSTSPAFSLSSTAKTQPRKEAHGFRVQAFVVPDGQQVGLRKDDGDTSGGLPKVSSPFRLGIAPKR